MSRFSPALRAIRRRKGVLLVALTLSTIPACFSDTPTAQMDFKPLGKRLEDDRGITDVSFSPDGKRILGSCGKTARLWSAPEGTPVGKPMSSGDEMLCPEFSPDGRRIVTGSYDGVVRLTFKAWRSVLTESDC